MYQIKAYYDKDYRGLSASEETDNRDTMIDIVHNLAAQGGYIKVKNTETGDYIRFDSDTYWKEIYYEGEIDLNI